MADERSRAAVVIAVAVIGAVVVAVITIGVAVWPFGVPRSFDERELDPLIAGMEVVDEPREACPQGRRPVGDCDAVAEVRSRDDRPARSVVIDNAQRDGFAVVDPDGGTFEAVDRNRCLTVHGDDVVRLTLSRC